MPCFKSSTNGGATGVGPPSGGGYATEADCLNACKEGACCESNGTCSVKPACQCQGTGKVFKGVGTVCTPNPCLICGCATADSIPQSLCIEFKDFAFEYNFCIIGNCSLVQNAETQLANYLHGLRPVLPLKTTVTANTQSIAYSTPGCLSSPCAGCDPSFTSTLVCSGVGLETLAVAFTCDQVAPAKCGGAFFALSSAPGCQPTVPGGGVSPSRFTFQIPVQSFLTSSNICNLASNDFTSVEFSAIPNADRVVYFANNNSVQGFYKTLSGRVIVTKNPLP
jgi:hypothetical protein